MKDAKDLAVIETVESRILLIRHQRVILDAHLAALYGVTTKRLMEQVNRNADRFPADFVFQLEDQEVAALRSQFATSKQKITVATEPADIKDKTDILRWRDSRRYPPHA